MSTKLKEYAVSPLSLYRSAVVYLASGLAAGLYYRTLTHSQNFEGTTVLGLAHTHFLALGFIVSLALLALARTTGLAGQRWMRPAMWTYHAGIVLTAGMLVVKGTGQVLGWWVDRPMYAGISGMGHILLTVALAMVMVALRRALMTTPVAVDSPAAPAVARA